MSRTLKRAYPFLDLSPSTLDTTQSFLQIVILACIGVAAVSSRLFAVVRFESIIHELQAIFFFLLLTTILIYAISHRATKVLTEQGLYEFWNWFDPTAWYPLGRVSGGTLYPGLMLTSGLIFTVLHSLNIPVDIREICVMLAPAFSGLTAIAAFLLTREIAEDSKTGKKGNSAGLWAALFIGITPGYISRSVAGSYDNEAIAIFILVFTFYLWIKALKEGSALYGTLTALFYFYMVGAWGGYAFITNMLPLHVFVLLLMGRFTTKIYVAYSTYYSIGTLAAMSVPFVGFQPIRNSEHMAALGVFGLLQLVAFGSLVSSHLGKRQFQNLLVVTVVVGTAVAIVALALLTSKGYVAPWTGRFYSLWDTGYAKIHIPIIASVSEHQPTAWPSFFFDLNILIYLFPAGVYICFNELRNEHVFVIAYAVIASYFAGVMVRLMLTLTPIVCVAAAVVVDKVFSTYLDPHVPTSDVQEDPSVVATSIVEAEATAPPTKASAKHRKKATAVAPPVPTPTTKSSSGDASRPGLFYLDSRGFVVSFLTMLLLMFCLHCTWVTSNAYSSPSVVLASRAPNGEQSIIDDFREAYYWLRQNTEKDAKVMSWWDYGYQLAGFADRTTLVDNATWNNTHIATVGKAMSSKEEVSYPILRQHDVDYVLIVFGGLIGYSGDDINKFLWMIRIAEGIWPDEVSEGKFFNRGEYRVDDRATPTMSNSLMYKMSYYRFAELFGGGNAVDRVRQQKVPSVGPVLDTLDEAFTSENWIVRIYQVKKPDALARPLGQANAFERGTRRKRTPLSKPAKTRRVVTRT